MSRRCGTSRNTQGKRVEVILKGVPSGLRLRVMDYGKGFGIQAPRSGLGLVNREERARAMGGTFHVESEPGEGAGITVEVPSR